MSDLDPYIQGGLTAAAETESRMSTLSEVQRIQQQIAELQARQALLIMEGRDDAIATIKTMMVDYTIGAEDLGLVLKAPARPRAPRTRKPGTPRYRDPATQATWTGQGAAPKWLEGKNREDFLIEPAQSASAPQAAQPETAPAPVAVAETAPPEAQPAAALP